MAITSFGQKFVHDLGVIYDAEQQFLAAQRQQLPQVHSQVLKEQIQEHILQTQQQIANLEQIFGILNTQPFAIRADAATGLVMDGTSAMQEASENPQVADCVITAGNTKIEHFEIACYRALITDAETIGHSGLLQLLRQNLDQETQTAAKLEESYKSLLGNAVATQKLTRTVGAVQPLI